MMRRKVFAMFPASLVLLLFLMSCGKDKPAAAPAAAPEVTVLTLSPQPVTLTTELPGRTSAHLMSEVRPQVGGIIQKRLFREGGDVKAGEVLYQIDPATYQAAYDNAKATLAKAEANALPTRYRAERYANLIKARAVSKQDNDDAQAASKQADAEIIAAKAALETARINLGYTRVVAPISGRIGKSSVTPGALVTASQPTALATIQQIDPIYVDVTQSSTEVLRLKRELESGKLRKSTNGGAKVRLLLDDGQTYGREGVLQFADITVEQSTGEVTLRAEFPNPGRDLLPGLYVRAMLEEGVNESALLVPQAAISRDAKGNPLAMVVKGDGAVEPRPVVLSRIIGDAWLVESGLSAGEKVIVEGLQKVRPGVKVKAVEASAQSNATQPAPAAPAAAPGAAKAAPAQPEAKPAPAAPAAKPAADKPAKAAPEKAAKPEAKAAKPAAEKAAKPSEGEGKAVKAARTADEPAAKPEKAVKSEKSAKAEKPGKSEAKAAKAEAESKGAAYSPPKGEWPVSRLDGTPATGVGEAK